MNIVHSITRQREGFGLIRDYDIALYRLKCYRNDVYHGISPNINAPDYNPEPPIFACQFCTTAGYEQILALANEDGKVALQNTTHRGIPNQMLEGTQAHSNAIFDVSWMPSELKLVTVSGDHTARLWDVAGSEIRQINCFLAHTRSVKTVVFRREDKAVFATGARDGAIMVWDIRATHNDQPKPDNCISNAHDTTSTRCKKHRRSLSQASRAQSITGLAFQDDVTLVSCAAGDSLIKVWDLRKNYTVHKKDALPKHVLNYTGRSMKNGFTSILVCPAGITLYASCMDDIIYAYNIASYNPKPVAEFYGHQNSTFYVKSCLSPDGRYLASGSSDELAYIWHTDKPGDPLVKLSGHTEEVTCIAWSRVGETKIVTCSDDSCHRIWRVGQEHRIDNAEIEIQGQAEAVRFKTPLKSELETTPSTSRRRWSIHQEHTPESDTTPGVTSGSPNVGETSNQSCKPYDLNGTGSCAKRSYSQMIAESFRSNGKFKSILSPVHENLELIVKRAHIESRGARRLFSSVGDDNDLNRSYESVEPTPCSSVAVDKSNKMLFSPTLDLPNFVIDGKAPHLLEISPQKSKENIDWLTKIRKEKYEQSNVKTMIEKLNSPKAEMSSARKTSRSRSRSSETRRTPRSPSISLLNFFKVMGKDYDKEVCSANTSDITLQATPLTQR